MRILQGYFAKMAAMTHYFLEHLESKSIQILHSCDGAS